MALGITDLKKGMVFEYEGVPYKVVEYNQKVMGRGGSIVNVRIKSLLDGRVLEKTFKGNESLEMANVQLKKVQYLYNDGAFHFMDGETYEQFELSAEMIGDDAGYLKEGIDVQIMLFNGNPVSLELPKNVYLLVTYAEEVVRGDTANAVQKPATLETGLQVRVPSFIKQGDIISIDTTTGVYRERKKD
jgi:elongation factor P